MKKFTIMLIGVLIFFSLIAPNAYGKDDLTGTMFEDEMRSLIEQGVLEGYGDGTYGPKDNVTRAQFTTFVIRALDIPVTEEALNSIDPAETNQFTDTVPGKWYYPYTVVGSNEGLINGRPDGSFSPNANITRQDMAMILINAAELKGIVTENSPLTFKDSDKIQSYAKEAVSQLTGLGIINGKGVDGEVYFAPKDLTTRGQAAAFIDRFIKVLNPPEDTNDYSVATLSNNDDTEVHGKYETYDKAVSEASGNQVVLKGNNIVWINEGKAVSNSFTNLYRSSNLSDSLTYFTSGTEVEILEIKEDFIKVKLADTTGFLDSEDVNLVPSTLIKNNSYYYSQNGDLYHYKYNAMQEKGTSYLYGKAPSFMKDEAKYYSYNGNTFKNENGETVGKAHQYFNRTPLYSETSYTADQLDEFIKSQKPESPLVGAGKDFKKAEELHGTNALYLMAHAIHESNWGNSKIAQDKNNLFGIGAVDGTPYESAYEYESLESGILEAAEQFIVPGYFENEWKSYGAHLGNKSTGMNVFYASDPYWGQKISGHMYKADKYLSNKFDLPREHGAHTLGETLKENTNVRDKASTTGSNVHYFFEKPGSTVQILESISTSDEGEWYRITPKNYKVTPAANDQEEVKVEPADYGKAFVYSDGASYGKNIEKLNIAK